MNPWILLLPILLPLACGFLLFVPALRTSKAFLGLSLAIHTACTAYIAAQADISFTLFALAPRLPFMLRVDNPARLFSLLASGLFLVVGLYSLHYMDREANKRRFYLSYLWVAGMLSGMAYAGNMLTLYLFFEASTLCSLPLVYHSLSKEAVVAALKYLFYSVGGASLALVGLFYVYTYGTTLEFTTGGVLDMAKLAGQENAMLAATLATIIGFGAKTGMFPLHAWLPIAHPIAPAPASAVLSGVITKAGLFATGRFVFQLVGADFIRQTYVQYIWLTLAIISIVLGSVQAYREPLLKKRLAYSSISQVSYIQFGLATLTSAGFLGATLHMVFHGMAKSALFMVAGAIILKSSKTKVQELHSLGSPMPLTMLCFTLLSIAFVGIPPAAGFISKWYIAAGSLASETSFVAWLGPAILLLSALLTAGYLFPISIASFFSNDLYTSQALPTKAKKNETNASMLIPIVLLTCLVFLLGVFPHSLSSLL